MAFHRTPLLGSQVLLLSHIRGVLPNWQCLGRSKPQLTWTRSYANAALRILNVCGPIGFPSLDVSEKTFSRLWNTLKRAGLKCCVLSNTIALHWERLSSARLSVLRTFRSHFRFPPDQMRKAREGSVFVRSERAKGSNVGMFFSRQHVAKCRKSEGRRLAWGLILRHSTIATRS